MSLLTIEDGALEVKADVGDRILAARILISEVNCPGRASSAELRGKNSPASRAARVSLPGR